MAGVPHIFGGIRNSFLPPIKLAVLRAVNNHLLNYTIANNYSAYRMALDYGFKRNVFVIHNGIKIRPIPTKPKPGHKIINIVSVGRFVKQKDYETALRSIAYLKRILVKNQRFRYKIVGSGPEQEIIVECIEKYGIIDEVELITDPPGVYDLLESSDIYLCTSTFEGISNAVMEAMNCALPIVATNAGDNSHLVIHEKNGFIADIRDFKKIAEYLRDLIETPERRSQMGLKSYDHLTKCFGYESFRNKYLEVVEHIDVIQIHNGNFGVRSNSSNG
jgi:glycosyltransferase involved in cell wall biosynthesis